MFELRFLRCIVLFLGLGMAGCGLGPPPIKPEVIMPPAFSEAASANAATPPVSSPGTKWWRIFADPQLDQLITVALANNPELTRVQAQLGQARATFNATRTALWPRKNLSASYTRSRVSQESALPYQGAGGGQANTGLTLKPREYLSQYALTNTISYETDLFGRLRHMSRAATAEVVASEADLRGARLALTTQVAASWYQLVVTIHQEQLLRRQRDLSEYDLDLQRSRVEAGLVADDGLRGFEQALADVQILVDQVAAARARQVHSLVALCGLIEGPLPVVDWAAELPTVPVIPPGVPSSLLERRPDIVAASARLEASVQQVGAARANFFPQISLTGALGFQSESLANLISSGGHAWSFIPTLSLPIFDRDQNRAELLSARSEFDAAASAYRGQVLTALREVDDALSDCRELQRQVNAASSALVAAHRGLAEMRARSEAGLSAEHELINAEQGVLVRANDIVAVQGEQLFASIALVQALGGEWSPVGHDSIKEK